MNEQQLMHHICVEDCVALNYYRSLLIAGGQGSKAATFYSTCKIKAPNNISNTMFQLVASEFYVDKRQWILTAFEEKYIDSYSDIAGLIHRQFENWYKDYWKHKQAQYVQAMERYDTNYDVLTYDQSSLEDKLMTEEQLNNIATYMATATNEEQFIYMCEIGLTEREMVASHTIGNFPGRASISMQAYRVKRTKLFNKLRRL
tara:strand:+ start:92 stop:697 length:606 start_codon:yes stop_codon:yes gene_type:complete